MNTIEATEGIELVLAGVVGCYLLGIFVYCHKNSTERNPSFYAFNPSIWNRRFSSPSGSASKR